MKLTNKYQSLDLSLMNTSNLHQSIKAGERIEFECFNPYLCNYQTGMLKENLIPDDRYALALTKKLRNFFAGSRLISLFDDLHEAYKQNGDRLEIDKDKQEKFQKEIIELLKSEQIIREGDKENINYLLIPESSKKDSAEGLCDRLREQGLVEEGQQGLFFKSRDGVAMLRDETGKYSCVALDASCFLAEENRNIVHVLVLPLYFKKQQKDVRAIIEKIGVPAGSYHNIFYNPESSLETITNEFDTLLKELSL